MTSIEPFKCWARVRIGAMLHHLGLYRRLLPVVLPQPSEPSRRLQSYLNHFYEQADHAEADLYLPELGLRFACDIKDHMLWHYLEGTNPIYELTEINHCRALVRPTDHIVDIGANHGFWGFTLAHQAGPRAWLYLCEANPTVQARLHRTLRHNSHLAALLLPYAISDGTTDHLSFYLPIHNLSGLGSTVLHSFAEANGYLRADRQTTVPARSLDALTDDGTIKGMDVVKIDVEQAEDAVVRGALRAFARFKPRLIMIETAEDSWTTNALREMGYATYCLNEKSQSMLVPSGYWGNIFFTFSEPQ